MKNLHHFSNLLFVLLVAMNLSASVSAKEAEFEKLFQERDLQGTIVVAALDNSSQYIYNDARAEQRFLPASTFKILNTLIALDEGVIHDENEVIPWDGQDKGWAAWNTDHTLETAFPVSCVWCYQELAKRVGHDAYVKQLHAIGYGNEKTGPDVTTFWLQGDLKISPLEQIAILRRVYTEDMPYAKEHIQILKRIMRIEQTPEYTISAKTGRTRDIGWYVGYVETEKQVWLFAINITISKTVGNFRQDVHHLLMEALARQGIL
jgi:beta-lactamase class D